MLASTLGVVVSSVIAVGLLLLAPGPKGFDKDSCKRLEESLGREVFGQTFANSQFVSAVCDHLWEEKPLKPLVMSIHGPPGVGKSFSHFVAARALYNVTTSRASDCPGHDCGGYRVVYGLDYTLADREEQSEHLVRNIMDHLRTHADSVVVIEEYDKLDCKSRGVLKQIFDKGFALNVTMQRSIFLLESNTGYGKIAEALGGVGGRQEDVDAEKLQYTLKNMMFNLWQRDACEERVDTVKALSLIDMFVPYFPLNKEAITRVIDKSIQKRVEWVNRERQSGTKAAKAVSVRVSADVLDFLCGKIEWDGVYAVEGAKEVQTVIRRHVFGLLYGLSDPGTGAGGDDDEDLDFRLVMDEDDKRLALGADKERGTV